MTPWVAAPYTFEAQPKPFDRAMDCNRFAGVIGTAWRETATWPEKRANDILIGTNKQNQEF